MSNQNLEKYNELRAQIEQHKEACDFIPDVTTKEGYEKSKRVSLDAGKVLTAIEKTRKELKADALEYGRLIDSTAKEIVAEIEAFQLPHKNAYKELDRLKKEAEAKRKQDLEDRVAYIRDLPASLADSSSDEVKGAIELLSGEECLDFSEYTEAALKARNHSRNALADLFAKKLKDEEEKAELDRLRKEQAEREQKEHEEAIAEKAKRDAELAAQAAIDAAEREKNEAIEREKHAKEAERQRIEAEQAEIKRQEELRAADVEHRRNVNNSILVALSSHCVDDDSAKALICAISRGEIPHVSINY